MIEYVVGFAFDGRGRVALIRKNRPEWQAGRLNGIGGHVETTCQRSDHINSKHDSACYRDQPEDPDAAMVREFEEETGVRLDGWEKFVVMDFPGARIHFYRLLGLDPRILDLLTSATDEEVCVRWPNLPMSKIPNLSWLIPLAAYTADRYEPIHVKAELAEVLP